MPSSNSPSRRKAYNVSKAQERDSSSPKPDSYQRFPKGKPQTSSSRFEDSSRGRFPRSEGFSRSEGDGRFEERTSRPSRSRFESFPRPEGSSRFDESSRPSRPPRSESFSRSEGDGRFERSASRPSRPPRPEPFSRPEGDARFEKSSRPSYSRPEEDVRSSRSRPEGFSRPEGSSRPIKYKHSAPLHAEKASFVKRPLPLKPLVKMEAKTAIQGKETGKKVPGIEKDEVKVYGLHACKALFKKRPEAVIRLYCLESMMSQLPKLIKYCVDNKKAYHIVTEEELERITDSIHHEGICLLTKQPPVLSLETLMTKLSSETGPISLIYLEGVENPHNIGSLIRICAHFGACYLLTDAKTLSSIPSATYRVAQGGVESITCVPLENPHVALKTLQEEGFSLIASSSHSKTSLYKTKLPKKAIFLFGSETHGISEAFLKRCASVLAIPGSGFVESLNVSISSALFLGEFWRQHGL